MTLAVSLPVAGLPPRETPELVQAAARWGYRSAWASEVAGPDFASLLGAVAIASDVDLGVAVAPAQTRAPWLLAATAASLSHLSEGRFSLGVGTSSEIIVARWSGLDFDHPLDRLRETVEALRPLLDGEKVDYEGRFVHVRGARIFAPPPTRVPLLLGALNPRSLRQAGGLADGVCLNQLGPEHLPAVLDEVAAGARAVGRVPADLAVVARLFCWVTDDPEGAREQLRRTFAPYAAVDAYNRFFEWLGFEEEAAGVREAMAARDREAAARAVSDRMLDSIAAVGDADRVAARVRAYLDGGVTTAAIACPSPDPGDARATLEAVGTRLGPSPTK
ncbi:LLM class F420-dependent oxidoreductase [Egibacter rhizosphaerae]|nr:LLM class F420-dependent oxidoreductase [Egibacter rhizosphaerae]